MKRFSLLLGALIFSSVASASHLRAEMVPAPPKAPDADAVATDDDEKPSTGRKVAMIRLSNPLVERPEGFKFSLFGMSTAKSPALSTLMTTLNKAAKDPSLNAVVVDLNSFSLSLSQAQELGQLLSNLKKSQKIVAVYASDYDTSTYVMASHASFVLMPENGNILMPGVSINMLFFRGLLDTLKVTPDFVQVGDYKGAEEPFMRTEASEKYKAQITGLVDGMYDQIKTSIATNRPNLEAKDVEAAINEGWLTGKRAAELKLVDMTMPRDKVEGWLEKTLGGKYDELKDYGTTKKKPVSPDSPFAILEMFSPPKAVKLKDPAIAVIYANGVITGDMPEGADSEEAVTPGSIRKSVDKALKDDLVKAIVLRVDSPGGSASASDEIWQIIKDADKKKPVTVSQGRMAASGGYYISCAGRSIAADPATITGSIGVVGGKLVLKGTMDWLGVNVQTVSKGQRANLFSFTTKFTDDERAFIKKTMTETYDQFKKRIAEGRGAKIKDIEEVAGGRLFTGTAAMKAGLVDKIATLNEVVLTAAKDAGIDKNFQVLVYPEAKTIGDLLREGLMNDASMPAELTAGLKVLPASYQAEMVRMLAIIKAIEKEKVLAVLPGLVEGK